MIKQQYLISTGYCRDCNSFRRMSTSRLWLWTALTPLLASAGFMRSHHMLKAWQPWDATNEGRQRYLAGSCTVSFSNASNVAHLYPTIMNVNMSSRWVKSYIHVYPIVKLYYTFIFNHRLWLIFEWLDGVLPLGHEDGAFAVWTYESKGFLRTCNVWPCIVWIIQDVFLMWTIPTKKMCLRDTTSLSNVQVEFHQELRVCNAFASEVAFDVARGPGDSQMAG